MNEGKSENDSRSPEPDTQQAGAPDGQPRDTPAVESERAESTSANGRGFHWGRVLAVLIPLCLLALLGFGFLTMDGSQWLGQLFQPRLVPVKGSVFYQGQPVVDATIMTWSAGDRFQGALGVTDEYGEFELQTDIRGTYQPGAFVGKHKVTVALYEPATVGPPGLKSPPKFASAEATPVVIEVTADGLNEFQIRLDDYMNEGDDASRAGTETAGLVATLLNEYDTDESGSLSMEEIEAVDERYREEMKRADVDNSGQLDATELRAMIENRRSRSEATGQRPPAEEQPERDDAEGAAGDGSASETRQPEPGAPAAETPDGENAADAQVGPRR